MRLFIKLFNSSFNTISTEHGKGLSKQERKIYNRLMGKVYVDTLKAVSIKK